MKTRLSERIRQARRHVGLSASEAASLAGLTRKSWERYELDKNEPKASSLTILVEKGIDATWLLTGEGSMLSDEGSGKAHAVDAELLRIVIEETETYRSHHNPVWDVTQTAHVIALGYAMMTTERKHGAEPRLGNLQILMQAASL